MSMRKKAPMPLDTLRKKQASQANDIAALKVGVLELQQRMAKVEVEVAVGKGEEPPTPVAREETQSDEQQAEQSADQQPETE